MPLIKPKRYNWELVFFDEFEGNKTIDESIWEIDHENDICDGQ